MKEKKPNLSLKKEVITKLNDNELKKFIGGRRENLSMQNISCNSESCDSQTNSGSCGERSCNC